MSPGLPRPSHPQRRWPCSERQVRLLRRKRIQADSDGMSAWQVSQGGTFVILSQDMRRRRKRCGCKIRRQPRRGLNRGTIPDRQVVAALGESYVENSSFAPKEGLDVFW